MVVVLEEGKVLGLDPIRLRALVPTPKRLNKLGLSCAKLRIVELKLRKIGQALMKKCGVLRAPRTCHSGGGS